MKHFHVSTKSFTLIELLVVMAVIVILTGITLGAAGAIQNKAARTRALGEVQAMGTALESYKIDNGVYPSTNNMLTMTVASPIGSTAYSASATILYTSLSGGMANFTGTPSGKVYISFRRNQLSSTMSCYVQDPFGYPYGYVVNTTPNTGMNPGFYDLWSTSGKSDTTSMTNGIWISNWSSQ